MCARPRDDQGDFDQLFDEVDVVILPLCPSLRLESKMCISRGVMARKWLFSDPIHALL
jgi:hypothetical protein